MTLRNFLLTTAAGAIASTGAVAADIPVAPEPVDYVRVCDAHGTGFFYIPGTDTCLRVGGDVRARYAYSDADAGSRDGSPSQFTARGRVFLDARNDSEWGTVRTFIRYSGSTTDTGEAGDDVALDRAFIQVGNFVAGYASSFLNMTYGSYAINNVYGTFDSDQTTWLTGYTFDVGNGAYISASIEAPERGSIETLSVDADTFGLFQGITGGFDDEDVYGGVTWPDAGIQIGVEQGWGSASVVGGVSQVRPTSGVTALNQDVPGPDPDLGQQFGDSEIGWFVGAGAEFNIGASTKIGGTAFYGDGAMRRLGIDGLVADGFINPFTGDVETSTAWTANLGLSHDFTSEITFNVNAGYFQADNDFNGSASSTNGFGTSTVAANADIETKGFMVGTSVDYTPLAGLTFSIGGEWQRVETDINANATATSVGPFSGTEDASIDSNEEDDNFALTFQVVREF